MSKTMVGMGGAALGVLALGVVASPYSWVMLKQLAPHSFVVSAASLGAATAMLVSGGHRTPWETWSRMLGAAAMLVCGSFPTTFLAFVAVKGEGVAYGAYVLLGAVLALLLAVTVGLIDLAMQPDEETPASRSWASGRP